MKIYKAFVFFLGKEGLLDNEYDFGGLGRTKMNLDGPMWNWTDLWYKYTFLIRSVKIVIF